MADLRTIAQSAVNPETGDYLTSEQRKQLFRKGRMGTKVNQSAFTGRSGAIVKVVNQPRVDKELIDGPPGALVKQDKNFGNKEVQDELKSIKYTFVKVLKTKKEKERLRDKYYDLLGKSRNRKQESDDASLPKVGIKQKAERKAVGFFGGLLGALGDIIAFGVLDWIGDPKNRSTVETFVKVFQAIFKFFDWYITGLIDNILGGLGMLVGGDSLLERIGGFFKLAIGIFGLRYLSLKGPLRLAKDLKFLFKNIGKFKNFFKSLIKLDGKGMKAAIEAGAKGLVKVFRKNLGRMVTRFLIKLFGRAFAKGAKAFAKFAIKKALGLIGKFPIIGPILQFGFSLAMGEPLGKAAFKTLGSIFLGGIGTAVGGPVGWAIGGLVGDWAGGALYDAFFGGNEKKDGGETPGLSTGGIASGPKSGYLVMLHGTEVVIPIKRLGEIIATPFNALGSGIIGGIFAVINNLGPVSAFIRPVAVSILGPHLRLFGMEKYSTETGVGEIEGSSETIGRKLEQKKRESSPDDYFGKDFLKNIGTLLMLAGGSIFGGSAQAATMNRRGGGGGSDMGASGGDYPTDTSSSSGGDISGSGISKAVKIAKRLQKDLGISAAAAAGIVGNLMLESGLQPDNVENGKGFKDGAINNIPPGTQRVGYGWGQWTNDRLEKFRRFLKARGADGRPATDEDNYAYLLHELRTSEPIKGHWKGWQGPNIPEDDPSKAATWFMMNWERPGVPHQDKRQKYAKSIFTQMKSGASDQISSPSPSTAVAGNSVSGNTPQQTTGLTIPAPQTPSFITPSNQPSALFDMSRESSIQKKISSRESTQLSPIFMMNNTQMGTRMNINNMSLNSTSIASTQVLNRI